MVGSFPEKQSLDEAPIYLMVSSGQINLMVFSLNFALILNLNLNDLSLL